MIAVSTVALALALSLACLRSCLARSPRRDAVVGVVGGLVLAWFLVCALAPRLGDRVLLVQHEGGTACTLESFFGEDQHTGALWRDGLQQLARWAGPPMSWLDRLDFAFAGATALGLMTATMIATRSALGGVVAFALMVGSSGFQMGARSETPSTAIWLATVAALPAWHLLAESEGRTLAERRLALASIATCAWLATGLRSEMVLLGGPLVAVAVVGLADTAPIEAAYARARRVLRRALELPWPALALALIAVLKLPHIAERAGFSARLLVVAAFPSLEVFRLPIAAASVLSLPVGALATVGIVSGLTRGPVRALTALTTVQLLAVYLSASHNVGWEMLRYTTMAAAMLWLHALAGWSAIERHASRAAWPPAWRGAFALAIVMLVVQRGISNPLHPGWWNANVRAQDLVHRMSKQREAEALLRAVLDAPRCTFVARVRRDGSRDGPMVLVTFGSAPPLHFEASPETSISELGLPRASCVKYFRTLDCNGQGGARCDEDERGATPERLVTERFEAYSDPTEYGHLSPVVRYGTFRLRSGEADSR